LDRVWIAENVTWWETKQNPPRQWLKPEKMSREKMERR